METKTAGFSFGKNTAAAYQDTRNLRSPLWRKRSKVSLVAKGFSCHSFLPPSPSFLFLNLLCLHQHNHNHNTNMAKLLLTVVAMALLSGTWRWNRDWIGRKEKKRKQKDDSTPSAFWRRDETEGMLCNVRCALRARFSFSSFSSFSLCFFLRERDSICPCRPGLLRVLLLIFLLVCYVVPFSQLSTLIDRNKRQASGDRERTKEQMAYIRMRVRNVR